MNCRLFLNLVYLFKILNKNLGLYRYVSLFVCVLFVYNLISLCLFIIYKILLFGWLVIFVYVLLFCYVLGYFFKYIYCRELKINFVYVGMSLYVS